MKRIASFFLALALAFSLTACTVPVEKADDGKIQIVATLFPYYDFARAIVGDRADVTLLLSPGREAHSFEPTPLDAVTISESDVFLYNGGEGEYWVDSMLGAAGENIAVIARMMDYVDALDEEYVEGMQGAGGHDHDHEHGSHDDHDDHDHDDHDHDHEEDEHDSDEVEYDEHIWTSPKNAVVLCRAVCDAICKADPANEDFYRANCDGYCAQIEALDARFASLCESAPHKLLVFADRFPMLYFCREFGLDYRAAFHGCSGDTEPSLATIKYLIDKVEDEDIPVVYTIDFGTKKVAAVVSECTGAAVDIDAEDTAEEGYQQLFVWDPKAQEIVGGYRFIVSRTPHPKHMSTEHYFRFSDKFRNEFLPYTIELGRSFVQPLYQGIRQNPKGLYSLDNLWDGLGALVVTNPDMKYFFGKVTMYGDYNKEARDLLIYFLKKYFPDRDKLVDPIYPIELDIDNEAMGAVFCGESYAEDYKILTREIRKCRENIPPLINSYMNISPSMRVFGTVKNPDFGEVEETGILITISDIYPVKSERHFKIMD